MRVNSVSITFLKSKRELFRAVKLIWQFSHMLNYYYWLYLGGGSDKEFYTILYFPYFLKHPLFKEWLFKKYLDSFLKQ
jgi:hypothetical protein